MSEFEDNLWLAVVRKHGDELARTERIRRHRRASRPQLLAGTTVGVAATAAVAAVVFSASTTPSAFAVTRNPDGTITINLMHTSGIAGANKKLAAMGVPAQIAAQAKAPPNLICPGGAAPTITFDPTRIPKRHVLVITAGRPAAGNTSAPKSYPPGSRGSGSTGSETTSSTGNSVVRILPPGSKIRTDSETQNHAVRMACP